MWPIVIGVVSFMYAGRTIYILCQFRRQFSDILSDSSTGRTMSRFFRLMALSATEMVFSLPLSIYSITSDLRLAPIKPWISWEYARRHVLVINSIPYEVFQEAPLRSRVGIDLNRWLVPSCAFAFFVFFGVSSEGNDGYKRGFRRVADLIGIKCPSAKPRASTRDDSGTGSEERTLATQSSNFQGAKDVESQN
ncbi:a-factor receptor [Ceratobasidium sp. 428]|nr:a-factor receptor [Ceratobasidium sp. 428]